MSPSTLKALVIACTIHCITALSLTAYTVHQDEKVTQRYVRIAQENAQAYASQRDLRLYNQLQEERSAEREDIHAWVEKRIDLKMSQALNQHQREQHHTNNTGDIQ